MKHLPFKFLLLIVVLLVTAIAPINLTESQAQAPCLLRTDWPTYVVRYGDTLGRIAQRYNTTLWTLMSANCITNPNRLFVGQRLYVPPGGGATATRQPQPGPGYNIPVTYQLFERGFMVFRVDNGHIWVFGNNGGYWRSFLPSTYGPLPNNPVPDQPPASRLKPTMGFGKVWGNYPEVRNALGWGVESERSWSMFYQPEAYPTLFTVTLAGRKARVFRTPYGATNWVYLQGDTNPTATPMPPPPTATWTPNPNPVPFQTGATYQLYENGLMIYRTDTQTIYVLVNDGRYFEFAPSQYGGLPDNPVRAATPPGKIRPAFGFGKVWGNHWYVRMAIGWAVLTEQGYTTTVTNLSPVQLSLTLPDRRTVRLNRDFKSWQFSDGTLPPLKAVTIVEEGGSDPTATTEPGPLPATPVPTSTPRPELAPTITFQAAYQEFETGSMFWRSDTREVWVFHQRAYLVRYAPESYEGWPDNPVVDVPPPGFALPINGFGKVWGNDPNVRAGMGWAISAEMAYTATLEQTGVSDQGPIYKLTLPSGASVTVNGSGWSQ
jgi:LysM domain